MKDKTYICPKCGHMEIIWDDDTGKRLTKIVRGALEDAMKEHRFTKQMFDLFSKSFRYYFSKRLKEDRKGVN